MLNSSKECFALPLHTHKYAVECSLKDILLKRENLLCIRSRRLLKKTIISLNPPPDQEKLQVFRSSVLWLPSKYLFHRFEADVRMCAGRPQSQQSSSNAVFSAKETLTISPLASTDFNLRIIVWTERTTLPEMKPTHLVTRKLRVSKCLNQNQ